MGRRVLIEMFTEGCPTCNGWLAYGDELAGPAQGHDLRVWDPREERDTTERERRMELYGIKELPAIVVDGEILTCCR